MATVTVPAVQGSAQELSLAGKTSVTARKHPSFPTYREDEERVRASYLADRARMCRFLVAHRFEGDTPGDKLKRAQYGYGIALNAAYLTEIFGHLRSAPKVYSWGFLGGATEETTKPPQDGTAKTLWQDATGDGTSWPEFFEGEVLEWMLSGLGGFVVADVDADELAPKVAPLSKADEVAMGKRPVFRFVPWSAVEDFGTGKHGFRWLKMVECADEREPDGEDTGRAYTEYRIIPQLTPTGDTVVSRYDAEGNVVGEPVNMGKLVDAFGRPRLNVSPARVGRHPDNKHVGAGLLLALADIVIDLYNRLSETSEGFRDACFGLMVHKGPQGKEVGNQLAEGTRLVKLGDAENASLERLAADGSEVASGLSLIAAGIRNWALSAKRQAAQAETGGAEARSGVSIMAEFSVDLKPILVAIASTLDALETDAMRLAAQLGNKGATPDMLAKIYVRRDTNFRLEDEAARISRIAEEFTRSLPLPAEAVVQLGMRWLESAQAFNMDEQVEHESTDATTGAVTKGRTTLREIIEAQLRELADAKQAQAVAPPLVDPFGDTPTGKGDEGKDGKPDEGKDGDEPTPDDTAPTEKKEPPKLKAA